MTFDDLAWSHEVISASRMSPPWPELTASAAVQSWALVSFG
jgi:hypothetical protein